MKENFYVSASLVLTVSTVIFKCKIYVFMYKFLFTLHLYSYNYIVHDPLKKAQVLQPIVSYPFSSAEALYVDIKTLEIECYI